MRIAVLGDIHANTAALEAVLADAKTQAPDLYISMGDQVNLGPCPHETLEMLKSVNATCLHGNHERYVLAAMAGDSAYAGANFESLRFTAGKVTAEEITFPKDVTIGGVTFTHAMPGDDYFPVHNLSRAIPMMEKINAELTEPLRVVCGHNHNPGHYRFSKLTVDCVGAIGCMDRGIPGAALYHIMTLNPDGSYHLDPRFVPYDAASLKARFVESGMADYCPVMAHIACLDMQQNRDNLVPYVRHAFALLKTRGGGEAMPMDVWREADRSFAWPDGMTSEAFWKQR